MREWLVRQRTGIINQIRAFLLEGGARYRPLVDGDFLIIARHKRLFATNNQGDPRLYRGGSKSLTVPAVAPQALSTRLRTQTTKHIDGPP